VTRQVRGDPERGDVPVLAVLPQATSEVATACLDAGADDVLIDPVELPVLSARVRCLLRAAAEMRRARSLEGSQEALLAIHALMSGEHDATDRTREGLVIAAETLGFERASLIAHVAHSAHAYVIAATDDPSQSQFELAMAAYPELREAIDTGEPLLIDDVRAHRVTEAIGETLHARGVRSLAVFPVIRRQRALGAVLFRSRRAGAGALSPQQVGFGQLFCDYAAAVLRDERVLDPLEARATQIPRAHFDAERRLRTIESLKDHFEAAGDGVFVVDEPGRILFVNRMAEALTGISSDTLIGAALHEFVPARERPNLIEVIRGVLGGTNLRPFDMTILRSSGAAITASVTTSTVLRRSGAVVFSFRDVTAQRLLEAELRKTKDFLERLIDSTVDGIIAADMRGEVILFNSGAERIYGYRAAEVIGRIPVWELYPDGVARQVMRMLRSGSHGGVGRLEQTRREVVGKDGELVPVNLTASLIYEGDEEVASVGVFSDLRERIRIEQRLLVAQEKLELREKQAVVAGIAGAAAHELNQPLTSIMGYTSLIRRQSDPEAPHLRALDVIEEETERMAEIVKKIGRIIRFETKEYVGGANILDLDRSTAPGDVLASAPASPPEGGPDADVAEPEPDASDPTTRS
jgi:PAS domain S-box-containing protein